MRDTPLRARASLSLAALCAVLVPAAFAGCVSGGWGGGGAGEGRLLPAPGSCFPLGGRLCDLALAAASSEEPPDESVKLLAQEPAAEAASRPRSRWSPGVRAGVLVSGGAERDWKEAPSAGLLLRQVPPSARAAVLELGADYISTETADGVRTSQLVLLRADLLAGRFAPSGRAPYLLAGATAILEQSTNNATGATASGRGAAVELGFGYGATSARWDLRAAYAIFVASENTESGLAVSVAFGF